MTEPDDRATRQAAADQAELARLEAKADAAEAAYLQALDRPGPDTELDGKTSPPWTARLTPRQPSWRRPGSGTRPALN